MLPKIGAVIVFGISSYNKPFLTFKFLLRSVALEDKEQGRIHQDMLFVVWANRDLFFLGKERTRN